MRCSCSQKDVYFLLNILAKTHKDCGNFRTGSVILRIELAVRAVDDTCAARPLHRGDCVLGNGRRVRVGEDVGVLADGNVLAACLGITVQHGDELLTGDVRIRLSAVGNTVGLRPLHALLVPRVAAGGVLTCVTGDNGHEHAAGGGVRRGELAVAGAVHHALVGNVLNCIREPVRRRNIGEGLSARLLSGFVGLDVGYADRYLRSRHREGVNRVARRGGGNGLAGSVRNSQLIELIALVRGQGNLDLVALRRGGRRNVYAAVRDRGSRNLVGGLGGRAAGGTGRGRLGVSKLSSFLRLNGLYGVVNSYSDVLILAVLDLDGLGCAGDGRLVLGVGTDYINSFVVLCCGGSIFELSVTYIFNLSCGLGVLRDGELREAVRILERCDISTIILAYRCFILITLVLYEQLRDSSINKACRKRNVYSGALCNRQFLGIDYLFSGSTIFLFADNNDVNLRSNVQSVFLIVESLRNYVDVRTNFDFLNIRNFALSRVFECLFLIVVIGEISRCILSLPYRYRCSLPIRPYSVQYLPP